MKDYYVYLPAHPILPIWGCVATSVGFAHVLPGMLYPPHRHPVDHHFNWAQGRVLQRYVILLILDGRGVFECASMTESQVLEPGSIVLLFPGVWHRYKPDPGTGWVEHWIECVGPIFDSAVEAGFIQPHRSLLKNVPLHDLLNCFARCHTLARDGALVNQDQISTMGAHMLALLGHLQRLERGKKKKNIDAIVQRAQSSIAFRCHEPLDLKALATELGVSYSHLRHSFRARLGISLKDYCLNTRLERSQELLANTIKTVKEISEILGFDSASHFSNQFKRRFGCSPKVWRSAKCLPKPHMDNPRSPGE